MKWYRRSGEEYSGKAKITVTKEGTSASIQEKKHCGRCGGQGGADSWKHTGWTCFACGGAGHQGYRAVKLYSKEHIAKLDVSAEKRRATLEVKNATKKAAREAEIEVDRQRVMEDNRTRYPEAIKILEGKVQGNFLNDLRDKHYQGYKITERQAEAVVKAGDRVKEWAKRDIMIKKFEAVDGSLEDGRQMITAALISTKIEKSMYGSTIKALWMTDQGVKIWGTLPSAISGDVRGEVFKFNATYEGKEPKFGFYKRPAKVERVEVK